jgi:NADH:ubiquinone oxidoreductase subunit D
MNRNIFQIWQPNTKKNVNSQKKIKSFNLNFGPQHPAAHGVLRLILQLNGEIVERLDPHIGLLHRGTEKLIEDRVYIQGLPYFDRLDYVSMLTQEHAYCLAIESLLGTSSYTSTFVQVRTLYDELTRILNHLLAVACHALDVGSMSSVFWAFEEREKIMEFYERISGARMHAAFYRPNEVNIEAISAFLIEDILDFSRKFFTSLNEMHNVLTYNKIWKQRLVNIGVYSIETCYKYGLTGVLSRCVGIQRDIRLNNLETYGNYYHLHFRSYTGIHGDCYDRFLIRMNEMAESISIVNQVVNNIQNNAVLSKNKDTKESNIIPHILMKELLTDNYLKKNNHGEKTQMEEVINDFKKWTDNIYVKSGITYQAIESPKGEFGVTLIADNSNIPYKCKIRSPAYHHLQLLPEIAKGHFLADLVTLIGTIDIVFGEIDR